MSIEQTQELYTQIVLWFADHSPAGWYKSHINIEMQLVQDELGKSWVLRSYKNESEKFSDFEVNVVDKVALVGLFTQLFDLANNAGEAWTICDFFVYNTGKYEVNYSYDEPPRLSGKDILSGSH